MYEYGPLIQTLSNHVRIGPQGRIAASKIGHAFNLTCGEFARLQFLNLTTIDCSYFSWPKNIDYTAETTPLTVKHPLRKFPCQPKRPCQIINAPQRFGQGHRPIVSSGTRREKCRQRPQPVPQSVVRIEPI